MARSVAEEEACPGDGVQALEPEEGELLCRACAQYCAATALAYVPGGRRGMSG